VRRPSAPMVERNSRPVRVNVSTFQVCYRIALQFGRLGGFVHALYRKS